MMSQGLSLVQQQGQMDQRDFARGDDVAKFGESAPAIALTNEVAMLRGL
jgi:hypothetical protein